MSGLLTVPMRKKIDIVSRVGYKHHILRVVVYHEDRDVEIAEVFLDCFCRELQHPVEVERRCQAASDTVHKFDLGEPPLGAVEHRCVAERGCDVEAQQLCQPHVRLVVCAELGRSEPDRPDRSIKNLLSDWALQTVSSCKWVMPKKFSPICKNPLI